MPPWMLWSSLAAAAPQWTVQVDPLTAALGYAHVQFERAVAPNWSVYLGPHLRLYDSVLDDTVEPFTGIGAEAGARWFWAGSAPAGGWVGARGVAASLHAQDTDTRTLGGYGSVLAGYTAIFNDRWVLSGGAGAQYIHYRVEEYGPKGFIPALHTAIGVAF